MKGKVVKIVGIGALLLGFCLWIYGGARSGLYQTYYTVEKVDEITQLTYPENVDAFLPGIETLVGGFAVFAILVSLGAFLDKRSGV